MQGDADTFASIVSLIGEYESMSFPFSPHVYRID